MNTKDIFSALRSGAISAEDAEKALMSRIGTPPGTNTDLLDQSISPPIVDIREIEPGIAQVTMQDRQHKNAFSMELIVSLFQAFQTIQANPDYKVIILTGYENYFASGGSREGLLALYEGKFKLTDITIFSQPLECEIPVIAAMQGHSLGSGWCFGMFCDFVVMSLESSYACNHMHYGFTPGDGATLVFPEKLGPVLAREVLFTGKKYRGAELETRGAPIPIMPRKQVLAHALQLARELAEAPRQALVLLKAHMAAPLKKQLPTILEQEWKMQEQTLINKPEVLQKMLAAFDLSVNNNQTGKNLSLGRNEPVSSDQVHFSQEKRPHTSLPLARHAMINYPELVHLNHNSQGPGVFWIHGEGGGVEGYHTLARVSQRPFYGIQAGSRVRPQSATSGIQAIATYYVEIIRAIQPEAPYDLGGYSLGGVLAYEVARQLQTAAQTVQTLVMVDSLDTIGMKKVVLSPQTRILQAINMSLINRIRQEPEKLFQKLIHQKEVDHHITHDELLTNLIHLGRQRGLSLTKTESELFALFQSYLHTQYAFQEELFSVEALPDPQAIECYYFRNKSGVFYGVFQPYLTDVNDTISIDYTNYWQEWEQHLPRFHKVDIDASNHITLLFEPAANKTMTELCQRLYAK